MSSLQPPPLPPPVAAHPPGWWRRHWKWALPSLLAVCGLLLVAVFGVLFSAIFGMMRQSDAYLIALTTAKETPAVVAALGTPIEPRWWMSGQISTNNDDGAARLQIPVSGPRGDATIHVEAYRTVGVWRFSMLTATIDGNARPIDLLGALPPERRMDADEIEKAEAAHDAARDDDF